MDELTYSHKPFFRVMHLVDSGGLYGAERVILNLAAEMKKSQFIPVLGLLTNCIKSDSEFAMAANELGIDTIPINLQMKFNPWNFVVLRKYFKEHKINIIHTHGYKPNLLAFLPSLILNIPIVSTCHLWSKEDWKLRIYFKLESMILKYLAVVIGVSEEICDQIVSQGVNKKRAILIHNGINLDNYSILPNRSISSLKRELKIPDDNLIIGSIGRLTKQKAHHYLLDAVKCIKNKGINVTCIVLGEGYLRVELETKKKELGIDLDVLFLGFRKDAVEIMDAMDIFVLTSIDEGLPMALLEAMAKAKPVITTPVGAIDKVISHGSNGLLYNVGDIKTLVNHLLKIRNDKEYAKKLGKAARDTVVKQFSSDIMAKKYIRIYQNVLQAK